MSEKTKVTDRRLLAALDYIDQKYIDDVFDLIKEPQAVSDPTAARRTPCKHWKPFVALAACLILLSAAFPVVVRFVSSISDFIAGWGSETTEEPETTNGMYYDYILTEEDLAQINEAYLQKKIADHIDQGFELSDEDIERMRNSKYSKYALTIEAAMERSPGEGRFYFGKYGECFIFNIAPNMPGPMDRRTYTLGEYELSTIGNTYVVYNHEWIFLSRAYDRGLLSEVDAEKLYEAYFEHYCNNVPKDMELCQAYVDYSVLDPELIEQINSAWMKKEGTDEPLFESLEDLKYDSGKGDRYLGLYNGYYVFAYTDNGKIVGGGTTVIANHGFFIKGELIGYKDGVFTVLSELYKNGELTYYDISAIHDRFCEIFTYVNAISYLDEGITVSVQKMPKYALKKNERQMIGETLERYTESINGVNIDSNDLYITEYYGSYNSAYVFKYKSPTVYYDAFTYHYEDVGGVRFVYFGMPADSIRLYVYHDDHIYTLSEAYSKNVLSYGDVENVKKYYTYYHPYYLDSFADVPMLDAEKLTE